LRRIALFVALLLIPAGQAYASCTTSPGGFQNISLTILSLTGLAYLVIGLKLFMKFRKAAVEERHPLLFRSIGSLVAGIVFLFLPIFIQEVDTPRKLLVVAALLAVMGIGHLFIALQRGTGKRRGILAASTLFFVIAIASYALFLNNWDTQGNRQFRCCTQRDLSFRAG